MKQDYDRIEKAMRYFETHFQEQPDLEKAAKAAGLSPFHFQRLFKRWAGVTPKQFLGYLTAQHAKERLTKSRSVLDAAYESGLSGPGRLHDLMVSVEAMTPGEYKKGGEGLVIQWGSHPTPYGEALIAVTRRGVCGLFFLEGHTLSKGLHELKQAWPKAQWVEAPGKTRAVMNRLFASRPKPVNVLLGGSDFQLKVWEALLRIPAGSVVSYQDVAKTIHRPQASRAVGTAIGQNKVAYLIPCHRVIRESGFLGDYRWGSARKKALLGREAAALKK